MTCDQWREQIDSYVDAAPAHAGQGAAGGFEEHLSTCSSCTAEVLRRMELKRAVRAAGARYQPSAELRRRIRQQLREERRGRPRPGIWIPVALAAALLLAAAISGRVWFSHAAEEQAVAQWVDLHVTTLASANPIDVVSTDRHTVKPWFQGKLPFTFNLPNLDNRPYRLLGGRVVYLGDRPGAQLLFVSGKHELSVFILEERPAASLSGSIATRHNGFSVESWTADDLRYAIVSDAGANDVRGLRDLFRGAAGP
jgi:anti-sigma factor RsiW